MISSFDDANKALQHFIPTTNTSNRYTLERMQKLMDFLGNPQNNLKVIHVAGTSGKTSTSYYIASLLHTAGKTVGLSVSPHIDTVSERAQINLAPLPDKEYFLQLDLFLKKVDESTLTPTYFEVLVAFAYWLFAKLNVDYAVMEVGLGGLLDGTNVIDREDKVCVITDIGLDHTAILGDTIPEIAQQKAGIITPNNAVFMHSQSDEVMNVIRKIAKDKSARLIEVQHNSNSRLNDLPIFQQRNFNLAFEAFQYICTRDGLLPLDDAALAKAAQVIIPARMEVIEFKGKTIVLDGSHNQQKIHALSVDMKNKFSEASIVMLVSFGTNKTQYVQDALQELRTISDTIYLTAFRLGQDEPRISIDPDLLAEYCREIGFSNVQVKKEPESAFTDLLSCPYDIILVTGSFYLLNHVRSILVSHA